MRRWVRAWLGAGAGAAPAPDPGLAARVAALEAALGVAQADVLALRAEVAQTDLIAAAGLAAAVEAQPQPAWRPGAPPFISVIMPVRDRAGLVGRAIRSLQAQAFQQWELVVIDDGSTDGTARAVGVFLGDRRIGLFGIAPSGQCVARNHALNRATGEVVVYLDSDNAMLPGFLAGVAEAFAADPALRCAYGALVADRAYVGGRQVLWPAYDRAALLQWNSIDLGMFAHRRHLVAEVGGFDADLTRLVDWDFILRCTAAAPPLRLPLPTALYRSEGPDRVSQTSDLGSNVVKVRRKWLPPLPRPLSVLLVGEGAEAAALRRRGVTVAVQAEATPIVAGVADVVHVHGLAAAVRLVPSCAAVGVVLSVRGPDGPVEAAALRELLAAPGAALVHLAPDAPLPAGVEDSRIRRQAAVFDAGALSPERTKEWDLIAHPPSAGPLVAVLAPLLPEARFVAGDGRAAALYLSPAEEASATGVIAAMATGAVPIVPAGSVAAARAGAAGLVYADLDTLLAAIRTALARDAAARHAARIAAIDRAWLGHADDLVLAPMLEDWLSLLDARRPGGG